MIISISFQETSLTDNLDLKWGNLKNPKSQLTEILRKLGKDYDYVFLDCPPNLTMISENIFKGADFIFVPLIPTTLSVRTYDKLMSFTHKKGYGEKNMYAFFSMVESRKRLHRETMVKLKEQYSNILKHHIPYRSEIEKMGVSREPVAATSSRSPSTKAYCNLWKEIENILKGK